MQLKKVTHKNSDGSSLTYEFDVPPKQEIPKYDHPGDPKGTDTVPAWLTPGEFVMNAEATRMYKPQIEAMNEQGKAVQRQQGGSIPSYHAKGGEAGPCWDGYEMVGMKEKGGKKVPNCVPQYKEEGGIIDWLSSLFGGDVPRQEAVQAASEIPPEIIPSDYNVRPLDLPPESPMAQPQAAVPNAFLSDQANRQADYMSGTYDLLKNHEGYSEKPYKDTRGYWTVGTGHKITDPELIKRLDAGEDVSFTPEQLDTQLKVDTGKAIVAARNNFKDFDSYPPSLKQSLIGMNFQLGEKGTAEFEKMRTAMNAGNWEEAAKQAMDSDWAEQTPTRAKHMRDELLKMGGQGTQVSTTDVPQIFSNAVASDKPEGEYFPSNISTDVPAPQGTPEVDPNAMVDSLNRISPPNIYTGEQQRPHVKEVPEVAEGVPPMETPEMPVIGRDDEMMQVGDYKDILNNPNAPAEQRQKAARWLKDNYGSLDTTTNRNMETVLGTVETAAKSGESNLPGTRGDVVLEDQRQQLEDEIAETERKIQAGEVVSDQEMMESQKKAELLKKDEVRKVGEAGTEKQQYDARVDAAYEEHVSQSERIGKPPMSREDFEKQHGSKYEQKQPVDEEARTQAADEIVKATQEQAEAEGLTDEEFTNAIIDDMDNRAREAVTGQPELLDRTMGFFEEYGITDLFDKKEIGKMAMMYIGSRIMGYSHGGSLNFAVKNYATNVQNKQTAHAKRIDTLLKEGKYTKDSIKAFEDSKDIDDLVPTGATLIRTGKVEKRQINMGTKNNPKWVTVKVQQMKNKDTGDLFWQTAQGQTVPDISDRVKPYDERLDGKTTAGQEYAATATNNTSELYKEVLNTVKAGREDFNPKLGPQAAAEDFVQWAMDNGINPLSTQAKALRDVAYRQALEENNMTTLVPYLKRNQIFNETGSTQMWIANANREKDEPVRLIGSTEYQSIRDQAAKVARKALPEGTPPQVGVKTIVTHGMKKFAELEKEDPAAYQKYVEAGNRDDKMSAFAFFMKDKIDEFNEDRIRNTFESM